MIAVQHIHPMIVHFPIVFFLTLAGFDIVATLMGRNVAGRGRAGLTSLTLAGLAAVSALVAFYFGEMALDVAEAGGFHSDVAEMHEGLGALTMAAFIAWALVRGFIYWRNLDARGAIRAAMPVVEVAGAALVVLTAYYGGELVYGLGVNVARIAGHAAGAGG